MKKKLSRSNDRDFFYSPSTEFYLRLDPNPKRKVAIYFSREGTDDAAEEPCTQRKAPHLRCHCFYHFLYHLINVDSTWITLTRDPDSGTLYPKKSPHLRCHCFYHFFQTYKAKALMLPKMVKARALLWLFFVGYTGFEPVTSALSRQRSKPTELISPA